MKYISDFSYYCKKLSHDTNSCVISDGIAEKRDSKPTGKIKDDFYCNYKKRNGLYNVIYVIKDFANYKNIPDITLGESLNYFEQVKESLQDHQVLKSNTEIINFIFKSRYVREGINISINNLPNEIKDIILDMCLRMVTSEYLESAAVSINKLKTLREATVENL